MATVASSNTLQIKVYVSLLVPLTTIQWWVYKRQALCAQLDCQIAGEVKFGWLKFIAYLCILNMGNNYAEDGGSLQ